jgi:hypothetical protein
LWRASYDGITPLGLSANRGHPPHPNSGSGSTLYFKRPKGWLAKNFDLLKQDQQHPSLHFKKIVDYWSVRVGLHYRALAINDGEDLVWVWIGSHGEYDRLIK